MQAEQFKALPGSVLLAAGAAWEGFDFPGDCVSLLIITSSLEDVAKFIRAVEGSDYFMEAAS